MLPLHSPYTLAAAHPLHSCGAFLPLDVFGRSAAAPPVRAGQGARGGTLGATFRARRWSRGLEQREAARQIGVSVATYCGWETNRRRPDLRHVPAAIRFLGFDWRQFGPSLGDRIRHARTAAGMSIGELAAIFRVDPTTLRAWEVGVHVPTAHADLIARWLAARA